MKDFYFLHQISALLLFTMMVIALSCNRSFGQALNHHLIYSDATNYRARGSIKMDDSTIVSLFFKRSACKLSLVSVETYNFSEQHIVKTYQRSFPVVKVQNDFIHGDITYDFFYRSAIDTPFSGSNIQQHNIRANIQLVVAKQLPVTVQINSRQTNSSLFKNYTDVNFQFDSHSYNTAARDKLVREIIQKIQAKAQDSLLLKALTKYQRLQETSRVWLEDSRQLQQLIESKAILSNGEDQLKQRLLNSGENIENNLEDSAGNKAGRSQAGRFAQHAAQVPGSLSFTKMISTAAVEKFLTKNKDIQQQKLIDSIFQKQEKATRFIELYKAREEQYNKCKRTIDSLQILYKTAKENIQRKIEETKNTFTTGSSEAIGKKVKEYGMDSSKIFKWYRRINAVQQFSVGRSMVDYSELSAKNISITGIQAVYQSKFYLAFASGSVDYRYRDFIIRGYDPVRQYLNLFRLGVGKPDNHNLILTLYQGKKQANYFMANNQAATNKIFGITVQGKFRLNDNNYIVAEAAKSSYPQTAIGNTAVSNTGNKTFNFSNHSNEAYSVQLFSRIASTDTRIYGQYKFLGRNFQSFSIFNLNSDYTAWQARIDQYFLKKKLFVSAGLRTYDYNNPYVISTFQSNTVFKTVQATLRLKKWPVLSVGYMPSSQVISLNNQVIENHFYTLTASGNYIYRTRKGYMHTGLIYTRFYNNVPDTAFVYYNARNWFIYHHIIGNTFSFNSFVTLSYNNTYRLLTIDQGMNTKLGKHLSAGGGLKWNRLNNQENHIGYYGNVQFRINKLGEFNLSFDRGFIPGITEKLRKNDFGRATYIKTF